ncbi:hypothetical protein TNCV_3560701 [Trichonephila clavipes]|nr:hypothetical protein TNCV_3560701 [Trichonephila clavipes]
MKYYNKLSSFGEQHRASAYLRDWTDNPRLKKHSPFSLAKTLGLPSAKMEPHSLCPLSFDLKLEEINFHEELLSRVVKHSEIPELIRQEMTRTTPPPAPYIDKTLNLDRFNIHQPFYTTCLH